MNLRVLAVFFLLVLSMTALNGCKNDCGTVPFTNAPTGNDGFNDLTFLAGNLYSTNRELGNEIHNPVNLYVIDPATGQATGKHFLNMSDQGYLSITNDGEYLYLLGGGHSIIVVNILGEWITARTTYPDFMDWRLAAGTFNTQTGELYFLTEIITNTDTDIGTKWRIYAFDTETVGMTLSSAVELVEDFYLVSLQYAEDVDEYFGIAFDTDDVPLVVNLDSNFELISATTAPDVQVCGICQTATGWVLMTTDRRVLTWTP